MSGFRIAMICASNQNRSMEAHSLFNKKGYTQVSSFGTNVKVKLPGPSADRPLIYDFGTPYSQIADDLKKQDEELYTQKGLLHMLQRNSHIKKSPERFQDTNKEFDIIIAFEERVFDIIVEVLCDRESQSGDIVHIFNLNIPDNHEAAVMGAIDALNLVKSIEESGPDWSEKMDEILEDYQNKKGVSVLHAVTIN